MVFGNLKNVEKPQLNNIDIFVKKVYVDSKDYERKVEGWLNCDKLDPDTSRDGILEGSEIYAEFMKKLKQYLEKNFDKKSENKDKEIKSHKELGKMFVDILKSIRDRYPELTKPHLSGNMSHDKGMGTMSNLPGDAADPCVSKEGLIIDPAKIAEPTIGKPIGNGKGTKRGTGGESTCRVIMGDGKILSPSSIISSGNDITPELKVVVIGIEGKPVVFFSAPNRLVINPLRPSSQILIDAKPKDPKILKSTVLPLLVRAGIDAFPTSSEMSKEEFFEKYDEVLDSMWSSK